jgi:hypothetical protein
MRAHGVKLVDERGRAVVLDQPSRDIRRAGSVTGQIAKQHSEPLAMASAVGIERETPPPFPAMWQITRRPGREL